jgi:taurine ABC transporter substrate-binding protein
MRTALIGLPLAAATWLALGAATASAGQLSVDSLTVGYYANPNPERIAQQKGWFDEALGLKVQWKPFQSGAAMMAAITSGAIQFTCESGTPPIVSAVANGEPMQIFWVNENAAEALAANPKSGIKSPADLAGKKIGTIIGSTMYFSLVAAAQGSGVPIDKVDVINAPVPDVVAAYKRGDLDGVYLPYPGLGEVVKAGAQIVVTSDQVAEKWHYPTFDACVVNAAWAKDHGDVLTKWVEVEDKAVKYYQSNASDSYAAIAAVAGISAAEAQQESSLYHFPTAAEQLAPRWLGTPGNAASSGVASAIDLTGQLELKLGRIASAPTDPGSVPNPTFVAAVK